VNELYEKASAGSVEIIEVVTRTSYGSSERVGVSVTVPETAKTLSCGALAHPKPRAPFSSS